MDLDLQALIAQVRNWRVRIFIVEDLGGIKTALRERERRDNRARKESQSSNGQ